MSVANLQSVMTGKPEQRVEALRLWLGYPLKQRDSEGSRFWFLRPGVDENEAEDTCPIAVGFYSELNYLSKDEIPKFLTADEQQKEIYGHYTQRIVPNQPVMYLLLPEADGSGRVAMILPSEGKLRQRQIQTFAWTDQDLQARLNRLRQSELARTDRIQEKALAVIPLVEWAFYKPIETAKELAQKLAEVSRRIEQAIPAVYEAERQDGYLHALLTSFQRELLPTLKLKAENEKDYSFADIYAQTIAYGLFTARVFSYTVDERKRREEENPERKETDFNRQTAWELLPETNPFLRRLFKDVSQQPAEELGEDLVDAIAEVFSILRAAKMDAILADFRAKMNREDIVIRFYEDFLEEYKPQMRERRGVYYTPEPVVSYMVRSVDILLKEKFNKPLGLADPEVMILDPACGTGTFLLWIFQLIHQRFQEDPDALTVGLEDRSWSGYVKERLLPRIFGFELLMAPYAIAHLKLGLFLEETGYQFDTGKRLGVYLTDSLSASLPSKPEIPFEEFIAAEGEAAMKVKQKIPIMVVIGNPPYSNFGGMNNGEWIKSLIQEWKPSEEQKWNPDDFMKFLRWAQWRIAKTGHGILSFITNHIYLDGITHRVMRKSLIENFGEVHITDLHGNYYKKEKAPDSFIDRNIFGIKTGVAVGTFTSKLLQGSTRKLYYSEIWGSVEQKEAVLSRENISTIPSIEIEDIECKSCLGSLYYFANKTFTNIEEYCKGYSVKDIFSSETKAYGIKTDRDDLFFDMDRQELVERMKFFYSVDALKAPFAERYNVKNSSSYRLLSRRSETSFQDIYINKCLYRPFDKRWLYYDPSLISRPAWDVMRHTLVGANISLAVTRQVNGEFAHAIATDTMITDCTLSTASKERSYLFPLYIFTNVNTFDSINQSSILDREQITNISKIIASKFEELNYFPNSNEIFYYIYSILHSPTYRSRYAEFLKIDFPRVPFTSDPGLFQQLASYGEELVSLHLMRSSKLDTIINPFVDAGGNLCIEPGHPKYDESSNSVLLNKKGDKFTGVPKAVWELYVGGFQVCQKWLKDRKGCTLSEDNINHYQRILVALQETIRLMEQIDEAIPGFPIE